MKTTNLTRIIPAIAAACVFTATMSASAQTPPATPAPEKPAAAQPTQIVFVPKKMLEENKEAGKLKENTFYWTNIPDDAEQGPKVTEENGTPALILKGAGTSETRKSLTVVTLIRAYNVPKDARIAKITAEVKQTYDEWVDNASTTKSLPTMTYSFFKDGIEARKNTQIPLPDHKSPDWKTISVNTDIPKGAQQLVIVANTDFPSTLTFAAMEVTFR